MNDDHDTIDGLTPDEGAIAARLSEFGPLMREQDDALSELTPETVMRLRARVLAVGSERRQWGAHPVLSGARRVRHRVATGAATVAVLLAVVLAFLLRPAGPAFHVPSPTRADLLYNIPAPAQLRAALSAVTSPIHPRVARPYRGHLALSGTPGREPTRARAYELAPSRNVVPAGRRLLGIAGGVHRIHADGQEWAVAVDRQKQSRYRLHSLAVSLSTGELIYHDRRNFRLPHTHEPLSRSRAARIARSWLEQLGWSVTRLRLARVGLAVRTDDVREVAFDWRGVEHATISEATLWVAPDGSVIEAWVWPPVARSTVINLRPISTAWQLIQRTPNDVVVPGTLTTDRVPGRGALERASTVSLLVPRKHHVYLVPGYRFEGHVHLAHRQPVSRWVALASGRP